MGGDLCQPYPRQHRRVPRQLNTPTGIVPRHGWWLARLLLFCFPKASCHPADLALAVQTQVLEGSAGHPCAAHTTAPMGRLTQDQHLLCAQRPAQGTRSRTSRCSDVIYWCLWEALRPLWCEKRAQMHGREMMFPPRNAGESQKGRALLSCSHYKYTRYRNPGPVAIFACRKPG